MIFHLGLPEMGGVAGDLGGGGVGYFDAIGRSTRAVGIATSAGRIFPDNLIDNGSWHTYSFTFTFTAGPGLQVAIDNFIGSGGVAGDIFFDNFLIADELGPTLATPAVPEPSSIALLGLGLVGTLVLLRGKNKTMSKS